MQLKMSIFDMQYQKAILCYTYGQATVTLTASMLKEYINF